MMRSALSKMFGRRREQHCPPDDAAEDLPYVASAPESPCLMQEPPPAPARGPPAVKVLVNPKKILYPDDEEKETALLSGSCNKKKNKITSKTLNRHEDQGLTKKRPKIALLPILLIVLASIAVIVGVRVNTAKAEINKRSTQALTAATEGTTYAATGQTVLAYIPASSVDDMLESMTNSGSTQFAVPISGDSGNVLVATDQMVLETDASTGVIYYQNVYFVNSETGATSAFFDVACDPAEAYCHILNSDDTSSLSSANNYLRALLPKPKTSSSTSSSGEGNQCKCGRDEITVIYDDGTCGCVSSCFSHDAIVTSLNDDGQPIEKLMYEVKVGDYVLTGSGRFEKVYGFMDRHEHRQAEFLQIFTVGSSTANRHDKNERLQQEGADAPPPPLEITGNHLVYAIGYDKPIPASQLNIGDRLTATLKPGTALQEVIVQIKTVVRDDGIYSPLTAAGTIVVNGMVMSTYASPQTDPTNGMFDGYMKIAGYPIFSYHKLLHLWFTPMRLVCLGISDSFCKYHDAETGMSPWTEFGARINQLLGEARVHWIVELAVLVVIVAVLGPIFLIEQGVSTVLEQTAAGANFWLASGMTYAGAGVAAAAFWHMKQPRRA